MDSNSGDCPRTAGRMAVGWGKGRERMKDGREGHLVLVACSWPWLLLQGFSCILLWLGHPDKHLRYRDGPWLCVGGDSLLAVFCGSPVAYRQRMFSTWLLPWRRRTVSPVMLMTG